jgi:hypothetical protein
MATRRYTFDLPGALDKQQLQTELNAVVQRYRFDAVGPRTDIRNPGEPNETVVSIQGRVRVVVRDTDPVTETQLQAVIDAHSPSQSGPDREQREQDREIRRAVQRALESPQGRTFLNTLIDDRLRDQGLIP